MAFGVVPSLDRVFSRAVVIRLKLLFSAATEPYPLEIVEREIFAIAYHKSEGRGSEEKKKNRGKE